MRLEDQWTEAGLAMVQATEDTLEVNRLNDADVQVVALTVHDSAAYVFQMLQAGATGYVIKRAPAEDVIQAAKRAAPARGKGG